jgi:hypothetical protein
MSESSLEEVIMAFTGNEDHYISLEAASELTKNYRDAEEYGDIKGGFFGKTTIQRILDQEGCVGIRIYYGQDEDGTPKFVLVGVEENEDDIIEGEIAQASTPCPPDCGSSNELNSSL